MQDQTTGTSASLRLEADEVSVSHPYHSDAADAPNYLLPESVSIAPGILLAEPPRSVPAQRLALDDPHESDLAFRPSPADPTQLAWSSGEEEPLEVDLGSEQAARERAIR